MQRAMEYPVRLIAENSGHEGSVILSKVREGSGDWGFDADKEDEKRLLDQNKNASKIFPLTFYNKEVLAITIDYLIELGDHKIAKVR